MASNASSASTGNPWDYFPLALCINLRERTERFEEAKQELRKAGLKNVTFFRTERQADRDKAIIDSHMSCLQYAVDQGVPHVLIFEDDVLFQENHLEHMTRVVDFLRQRSDWKVFYLGGFIFRRVERLSHNLLRGGVLTTHGYIMKTEFAKEVLAKRPYCSGMSIDLFYTCLIGNNAWVHVNPLVCIQRPSESDGTWDKRSLNKSGWLGTAMIYTSLDWRERLRFSRFSPMERMRVQNGIAFFNVFRLVLRRRLATSLAKAGTGPTPVIEAPAGEFTPVALA